MRLVKYISVLLLLFCCCRIVATSRLHFNSRSITMADGLPSNCINAVEQDIFGLIWIGTHNGLCSYDGYSVYNFSSLETDSISLNLMIARITHDREGNTMQIDIPGSKLVVLDEKTYKVKGLVTKPKNTLNQHPAYVESHAVFQDSTRHYLFWLNDNGDLWIVEKASVSFVHAHKIHLLNNMCYTGNRKQKIHVAEGGDGILYIATYGNGLFVYNTKDGTMQHYTSNDVNPLIQSNFLSCILLDKSGYVWVGTESAGVACLSQSDFDIKYIYPMPAVMGDWKNAIRTLCKTPEGNLLVSDFTGKLYEYDFRNKHLSSVFQSKYAIYSILYDQKGNRWLGTRGGGLYINDTKFSPDDSRHYLMTNEIENLVEDWQGNVWFVSSNRGLVMAKYNRRANQIRTKHFLREESGHWINQLYVDDTGTLWIGSVKGLFALRTYRVPTGANSFEHYDTENCGLKSNQITCILQVSENKLWIGVGGHGIAVLDMEKKDVKAVDCIDTSSGLTHNNVIMMMKTSDGKVVATTEKGISVIDPVTKKIMTYHCAQNPLGDNFVGNTGVMGDNNTFYLGTYNGVACITGRGQSRREPVTTCLITDLKINGTSIRSFNDEMMTDTVIMLVRAVSLSHHQNNLQLSFTDLNYAKDHVSLFQYYLEGMETTWNSPTSSNMAIYKNLHPGKYVFHLRLADSDKETLLTILIYQPWYNTWWSWIFYLIMLASVMYYLYSQWRRNFNLKQKMNMQKELTQFRIDFFTQVSHEFRTPLAIIQNSIQHILDSKGEHVSRSALQTVKRNSKRLMKLINQLIEFRKIQNDCMHLNLIAGDVVDHVRRIVDDFRSVAHLMNINLTFTSFAKSYDLTFSPEFVETIVSNLVSNALKYTPANGSVSVKLTYRNTCSQIVPAGDHLSSKSICSETEMESAILISVSDSGSGVSKESEVHLFQPFMHGYISKGGMGVGLFLAHKMADIHHGKLSYERSEELGGASFLLTLPTDDSIYAVEDYADATLIRPSTDDERPGYEMPVREPVPQAMNMQRVAIIEDDMDMIQQMYSDIRPYFMVDSYMNGKDGYDGVIANPPDLILCDVKLPDMNGYDIVKSLKQLPAMRFIPVIILTALDDDANQIRGYEAGADDYMVKPCNLNVLVARMAQLIRWEYEGKSDTSVFLSDGEQKKVGETVIVSEVDKKLRNRMETIVHQNLADPDFSVEVMAAKLHLGVTKLFGKTKELTGMTPSKYILHERMKKAASMLIGGEYDVSEVSVCVGFRDPSYFNKCFKAFYGISPSKYGK